MGAKCEHHPELRAAESRRLASDGMTIETDGHGRPEPSIAGDEWETLKGFLEFHRATFTWKTSGLNQAQLAQTLGPSNMTLAGLIKHLTLVEDQWFREVLWAEGDVEPWASVDWKASPDWDFDSAVHDDPAELIANWQRSVALARANADRAYAEGGLAGLSKTTRHGETHNLRWIMTHMIEEYARHNGHVDLIRESIDGLTGE